MSQSRLGKPDPDLEGVGGSASFGAKMVLSLNGVDPGCMNPITGSTCRAKCSNILHDTMTKTFRCNCRVLRIHAVFDANYAKNISKDWTIGNVVGLLSSLTVGEKVVFESSEFS
jgi:hypothetical protein